VIFLVKLKTEVMLVLLAVGKVWDWLVFVSLGRLLPDRFQRFSLLCHIADLILGHALCAGR